MVDSKYFNKEVERHNEIMKALFDVNDMLIERGYHVLAIYLQGSQNYKLDVYTDEYKSDIDMKAFIMPTTEHLFKNKTVSKIYETRYGQVEVKDIRLFVELIKKANLTYLELLCTEFKVVDERLDSVLKGAADRIVDERFIPFLNALRGTARSKHAGVFKSTESSEHILDKFGYQPKELHHLARLNILTKSVVSRKRKLSESYIPCIADRKYLIDIKTGEEYGKNILLVDEAADNLLKEIDSIIEPLLEKGEMFKIDDSSIEEIDRAVFNIFKEYFSKSKHR